MTIAVEKGPVARIALDRPAKVNALTAAMMLDLAQAVRAAGTAPDARLTILEGRGPKGFCGGADIAEFAAGAAALRRQGEALVELTRAFVESPVPILSIVHGRTLGAGAMIVALSDLVLAADDLVLGCPEIRFGMYPVMVHAALLEKLAPAAAWALCASGRLLSAAEAQALGLVTEVLPTAAARDRAAFYAERAAPLLLGRRAAATLRGSAVERVAGALPAMLENYALPGIGDAIRSHLPAGRGKHGDG